MLAWIYALWSQDLYRHIENLQKNHRHEIGIERARHRDTQQTLEKMQELDAKLQVQLKVCLSVSCNIVCDGAIIVLFKSNQIKIYLTKGPQGHLHCSTSNMQYTLVISSFFLLFSFYVHSCMCVFLFFLYVCVFLCLLLPWRNKVYDRQV